MSLVLQIAGGVFLGLWLFKWVMTRPPRVPTPSATSDWVKIGLGVTGMIWVVLYYLHIALMFQK